MSARVGKSLGFALAFALGFVYGADPLFPDPAADDGIHLNFDAEGGNAASRAFYIKTPGADPIFANFDSIFTFSRAGATATYIGDDGFLKTAGAGVPRFESLGTYSYGPHNLITRSEDLSVAPWSLLQALVVGPVDGPGVLKAGAPRMAQAIREDGTNALHGVNIVITTTNTLPGTASFYAKYTGGREIAYINNTDTGGTLRHAWFNIRTGAVLQSEAGVTATIEALPGGWYRCSNSLVAGNNVPWNMQCGITNATGVVTYTGDGQQSILFAGLQYEQRATVGTYAATFGAAIQPFTTFQRTRRGLRCECNGATNQILFARDHTNAAWVKTTMTAALDQVGLDGTANTASSLLATGAAALSLQTIVQAAVASTVSFDIKRLIGSGTISICQDGVTFTDVTAQINVIGFTRVTLVATQLNPVLGIQLGTSGDKIAVDFSQFEAGTFATSRISTAGATASRGAETILRVFGGEWTPNAGTIFAEVKQDDIASGGQYGVLSQNNTGAAGGYGLYRITSSWNAQDGTTVVSKGGLASPGLMKAASSWGAAGLFVTHSGLAPSTAAFDGTMGTGTQIAIGMDTTGGADALMGIIFQLHSWPEQKSSAFIQAKTA